MMWGRMEERVSREVKLGEKHLTPGHVGVTEKEKKDGPIPGNQQAQGKGGDGGEKNPVMAVWKRVRDLGGGRGMSGKEKGKAHWIKFNLPGGGGGKEGN